MNHLEKSSPFKRGLSNKHSSPVEVAGVLKIVLFYAIFSGLYILLSDHAVHWLFNDPEQIILASIAKGWMFVAITSVLLFGLIRRLLRQGLEALKEREKGYRDLAEQSPAIIYQATIDSESKTTYISPRVSELGYSPQEWIDTHDLWLKLVHPEDVEWVLKDLEMSHLENRAFSAIYRLKTKHGQWHYFHDEARVVHDAEGKPLYLQGMMLDITDRKQAEVELKNSMDRQRATVDASPVPLALNDEQGNITYLNNAFIRQIGYTLEDIPTIADWWPYAYPDPQYRQWATDKWQESLEEAKRTSQPFVPIEIKVQCKDGAERYFMVSASSIEAEDGMAKSGIAARLVKSTRNISQSLP
jgi:PAS domain S-box-containing protein